METGFLLPALVTSIGFMPLQEMQAQPPKPPRIRPLSVEQVADKMAYAVERSGPALGQALPTVDAIVTFAKQHPNDISDFPLSAEQPVPLQNLIARTEAEHHHYMMLHQAGAGNYYAVAVTSAKQLQAAHAGLQTKMQLPDTPLLVTSNDKFGMRAVDDIDGDRYKPTGTLLYTGALKASLAAATAVAAHEDNHHVTALSEPVTQLVETMTPQQQQAIELAADRGGLKATRDKMGAFAALAHTVCNDVTRPMSHAARKNLLVKALRRNIQETTGQSDHPSAMTRANAINAMPLAPLPFK